VREEEGMGEMGEGEKLCYFKVGSNRKII